MTKNANSRLAVSIGILLAAAALAGCAREGKEPAKRRSRRSPTLRCGTARSTRSMARAAGRKRSRSTDGRIVYVGNDAGAKDYIGPQTEVIDLKGRMVVPGIQDVHIHPISGGIEANACDLNALETVEEYVASIKKYADEHPDEPWITGGGWSMAAFGPGALARKELIDAVVPDRPVILYSRDGHTSWVNSQGARGRRHHEGDAGPAGRPHRPRPEDRRGDRQPAGRRERPGRRQDAAEHRRRSATTACATRSRC